METSSLEIRLAEDNDGDARLVLELLREPPAAPFHLRRSSRLDDLLVQLEREPADLLLLDLGLPDSQGLETFRRVNARAPRLPIIIFSGDGDEEAAAEAVAQGAQDYLLKGRIDGFALKRAIRYAIERKRLADDLVCLNRNLEQRVAERTAQLQAANEELEAFSYSVSHDLRAPLRHIQGYVELLERSMDGLLSEKAKHHLKTIADASGEMGQLIDDLLAFSRTGRAEMDATAVDLDALVAEAIRGLEMATQGRAITWKVAPLPRVLGDPAMLKLVLVNLVGNAVKYSRGRDPAEVEVGCAGEENGRAILFVRDNGAGFDMQYAGKLFGVFQRLHRSEEFEGTGIGLATVRRIITRHGGRVWACGEIGQGATFFFTLHKDGDGNAN